ncbi:MAG: DUF1016 domain-containing protein [Gammaproteobacteria bacterium]|nr:DUF1016 domain-containing protein [Gammaproteobacteria bacterium]
MIDIVTDDNNYSGIHGDIVALLENARRAAARSVNALMTATYWEIGRRIVEFEQGGQGRAEYGEALLLRLATDLSAHFGRGFSRRNLQQMRLFYLAWPSEQIWQTVSAKFAEQPISETVSRIFEIDQLANAFPLPWSAYVRLLSVKNEMARRFYEIEALRCGWSVRQLDRQINSQFYERMALSRNKAAMLEKAGHAEPGDRVTPEQAIKDPFVLEFLDLKDEYSETQLEDALIHRLEDFLLELGSDFTFVGRQRRLRIGDSWFRVDLLLFHRRLRCLVIIDLKLTELSPADAGQMHMYCNYAREHWTLPDENPPVGLILCARHNAAVARYALEGLPNKVLAAEYQTMLPPEKLLAEELAKTRRALEARGLGNVENRE